MLIAGTNASDPLTPTDLTPVQLTGFEAHVMAGVPSPGNVLSSATWAEDRRPHCTSPGRWDGNWGKALEFAIGRKGRPGGNPVQQHPKTQHHLPQNSSTAAFFRSNPFPSFPLVQPPTRATLPCTERAQQSRPEQHQPTWHGTDQLLAHHLQTIPKPPLTRSAHVAPSEGWGSTAQHTAPAI